MRKILLLLLLSPCLTMLYAQDDNTQEGPIINGFGTTYKIGGVDLSLDKDTDYKVMFDVFTHPGKKNAINPLLNTVARFMNMHGHAGLGKEQMKIVVVVHGAAIPNMLSEKAHVAALGKSNPNAPLIAALKDAGVELYVCGQSLTYKGYAKNQLAEGVKVSLSAMTALVHYQKEGYQLINFN